MTGELSERGTPYLRMTFAGREWLAIVDTGFTGEVELPDALARHFPGIYWGQLGSTLAGGHTTVEDMYTIDFPFDGEVFAVRASFAPVAEILVGTGLLRDYRLEIDFPNGTFVLHRSRAVSADAQNEKLTPS